MFYHQYAFWLFLISLGCLIAERIRPWRSQSLFRPQFWQDVVWLIFNGVIFGMLFGFGYRLMNESWDFLFSGVFHRAPSAFHLISERPLVLQVLILLITADFIEWCVHNLLHRVPALWRIHRMHHSIRIMDWIGNFRFHWGEPIIYHTFKYLPLVLLGYRWEAGLIAAIISTTIGHLNHSNLNITYGPLRYVLNSPRMHIWHHDKELRGAAGVNFAVVFSIWDWLFNTAFFPDDRIMPAEIGYSGQEKVSDTLLLRFFVPFLDVTMPGENGKISARATSEREGDKGLHLQGGDGDEASPDRR